MAIYKSIEEIYYRMKDLVAAQRPYKFSFETLSDHTFTAVPVEVTDGADMLCVKVRSKVEDELGIIIRVDIAEFQDIIWEPVEIDDFDWKELV